jgi:uncharacterized protein YjbI with pentapeptide repeats
MTFKTMFGRTTFLAAALALSLTATTEARAACDDPARSEVNWSECDKSDANLSGANLSGALLSGAYLSGGADLSGAIWTDGRVCAEGSVGSCN